MSARVTPKTGLLRQWILLSDRKKFVVVASVAIISVFAMRAFFATTPDTIKIRHALTSGTVTTALHCVVACRL